MTAFGRFRLVSLSVVLVWQGALAQETAVAKEKAAANAVAKFVEQVRKQSGLPQLRRINDGHLRDDACRRAALGDKSLGQSTGIGPPEKVGTLSAFWYSTLDPDQPPQNLLDWARGPERKYEQPHRFAVGVCLVNGQDAERRYWIDVGTYMSAVKSILNIPTWD
jgi:hypothetical protein